MYLCVRGYHGNNVAFAVHSPHLFDVMHAAVLMCNSLYMYVDIIIIIERQETVGMGRERNVSGGERL